MAIRAGHRGLLKYSPKTGRIWLIRLVNGHSVTVPGRPGYAGGHGTSSAGTHPSVCVSGPVGRDCRSVVVRPRLRPVGYDRSRCMSRSLLYQGTPGRGGLFEIGQGEQGSAPERGVLTKP
jgi:hypothetical protein